MEAVNLPSYFMPPTCAELGIRLKLICTILTISVIVIIYILIQQKGPVMKTISVMFLIASVVYLLYNVYSMPKCAPITSDQ